MKAAQNTDPFQFDSLIDFMLLFKDDNTCKDHLKELRWADKLLVTEKD